MNNINWIKKVIFIFIFMISFTACSNVRQIEFKYEDMFPDTINLFTYSNDKIKIKDIKNKYKMIFYLTSSNSDSIERLKTINKIMKIYDYDDISYIILWEDKIPLEIIKKSNIDLNVNYTLKDKYSLSKIKPDGFLLNEVNQIMCVTGYSYIDVIKYIIDLEYKPNIIEKINEAIFNDAYSNNYEKFDKNKPTLIMFVTSNCRLCKETEMKIKNNLPTLQSKLNIITIRPDYDSVQEYDINCITDYSLVYYNAYYKAYNVENFPFFVVLDKGKQVYKYFFDADSMLRFTETL